jgi:hypothetical protein
MSNGVRYTPTFAMPTEYERAAMEARRRQRMAEMLAQQAYTPQDIGSAPIPSAAPLVQGLQAFLTARQQRKAEEALEKAEAADVSEFENLYKSVRPQERVATEPDPFADPMEMASKYTAPRMETYTPSEEEKRTLLERTAFGKGSPSAKKYAAALLAEMDKKPETEEFGTTPVLSESGEYVVFGKGGTARQTGVRGAPKTADMPNAVREYEYAKSQGYTGSFADWELRNRQAGAAKFVMPSEGERKDSYNLGRIVNASETIKNAIAEDPAAATPGFMETLIGALPFIDEAAYLAQSPSRQVIAAAQADLIDASLTLATGAAYTKEQLRGQYESLIPRLGESKESIAAKRKRVDMIIEAAKVRAGRAWTPQLETAMRSAFTMPISKAKVDNSAPPEGVAPAEWAVMTPEERQLWQK